MHVQPTLVIQLYSGHPRGGLPYESDADARQKFQMTPLKGTNLGVTQAFFTPKRYHYTQLYDGVFYYFFACNPKRYLDG